jgi:hypothetical protein
MSLKFRDKFDFTTFDNLMEEDANVVYELLCLASNIKKNKLLGFWILLFVLKKYKEKCPMLDPRFKTFHLVSSFIGHEQGKVIVEKYDEKSLFSMFLKCHYHLHPLVEFERGVVDQKVEDDIFLDILI